MSRWIAKNKEKYDEQRERSRLRRQYNISLEYYEMLKEEQGGVCAICHKAPKGRKLCVDHDHETGRVRALLCPACNHVLGFLEIPLAGENWGTAAMRYLAKHRKGEVRLKTV